MKKKVDKKRNNTIFEIKEIEAKEALEINPHYTYINKQYVLSIASNAKMTEAAKKGHPLERMLDLVSELLPINNKMNQFDWAEKLYEKLTKVTNLQMFIYCFLEDENIKKWIDENYYVLQRFLSQSEVYEEYKKLLEMRFDTIWNRFLILEKAQQNPRVDMLRKQLTECNSLPQGHIKQSRNELLELHHYQIFLQLVSHAIHLEQYISVQANPLNVAFNNNMQSLVQQYNAASKSFTSLEANQNNERLTKIKQQLNQLKLSIEEALEQGKLEPLEFEKYQYSLQHVTMKIDYEHWLFNQQKAVVKTNNFFTPLSNNRPANVQVAQHVFEDANLEEDLQYQSYFKNTGIFFLNSNNQNEELSMDVIEGTEGLQGVSCTEYTGYFFPKVMPENTEVSMGITDSEDEIDVFNYELV